MDFCHLWCLCVWCHCIHSFDFHHSSPLKREYVTAAVTFIKRSFEATFGLLLPVPVHKVQRGTERFAGLSFIWILFKNVCVYVYKNTWIGEQPSTLHPQDTSVVVVEFKCHTRLDYSIIINTALLCPFSRALQSHPRRADDGTISAPEGTAASAELCQPALFFPEPPQLFLLANDLGWEGSCRAKPQLSGRRSHRWARLSQLNPQAAGSDDAQDASYQQGVL